MELTDWVRSELEKRGWSIRKLARESGLTHPAISKVLSGKNAVTVNFCYRIARAFGESPETLMRMANLSAPMPDYGDWLMEEIIEEIKRLPDDKRQQVLDFIRFLARK
jgi:transcriptional regulator with XRE-family HTH domain